MTIQDIPLATIDGHTSSLGEYLGKVLLLVNVASKCGLTPQYEALEQLYSDRRDDGLEVLGFPANDFLGQEPGSDAEIAEFCSLTYGVDFPMFSKVSVLGDDQHPLFKALTEAIPVAQGNPDGHRDRLRGFGLTPTEAPDILWNFEKFVIARDGSVAARFDPSTAPDDAALVAVIDAELARPA